MSVDIRRSAPIIAAVLALAGVAVAAAIEPEPLPPPCPSNGPEITVPRADNGTVEPLCKPADNPKGGPD